MFGKDPCRWNGTIKARRSPDPAWPERAPHPAHPRGPTMPAPSWRSPEELSQPPQSVPTQSEALSLLCRSCMDVPLWRSGSALSIKFSCSVRLIGSERCHSNKSLPWYDKWLIDKMSSNWIKQKGEFKIGRNTKQNAWGRHVRRPPEWCRNRTNRDVTATEEKPEP